MGLTVHADLPIRVPALFGGHRFGLPAHQVFPKPGDDQVRNLGNTKVPVPCPGLSPIGHAFSWLRALLLRHCWDGISLEELNVQNGATLAQMCTVQTFASVELFMTFLELSRQSAATRFLKSRCMVNGPYRGFLS